MYICIYEEYMLICVCIEVYIWMCVPNECVYIYIHIIYPIYNIYIYTIYVYILLYSSMYKLGKAKV